MVSERPRILVLGLDSVPPELLFERFRSKMPHIDQLLRVSRWGTLRSCDPPITVPSWAVMFSGMDPGSLGVYGFRHRRAGTYWDTYSPTPQMLRYPMVWEILSRIGRRVAVVGMPPGYPPPRVNGVYVSDFLTPEGAKDICSPSSLAPELLAIADGYTFDVGFRADDRERIGEELFRMTRQRWAVARHLWSKEAWDLFAVHEIGPDRLHHTFWKYFDPTHPRYVDHPKFRQLVEDYYALMDHEIGAFLKVVPDDVVVMILSDHGSQGMVGCFCINEWLIERGYLTLRSTPPAGTPIEKADVDWSKTVAWGAGGYYARIFFNVRGREPEGILPPEELGGTVARLAEEIGEVRRPDGARLGATVRAPYELYREVNGDPPDLMVYFGDLTWRSAGTLGHGRLFLSENDTGPDDSVHSFNGVFAVRDARFPEGQHVAPANGIDVAATILARMGVARPSRMQGTPIPSLAPHAP